MACLAATVGPHTRALLAAARERPLAGRPEHAPAVRRPRESAAMRGRAVR